MGFFKWLLWTSFSVGLGIFLSTYDLGGATPLQRVRSLWKSADASERLDKLKGGVGSAWEDARFAVTGSESKAPKERHSPAERDQVNKLIAKKATGR